MASKKVSVGSTPNDDTDLDIDAAGDYEAYFKGNIPEPTQYDGITITWFNNFGIKKPNDPPGRNSDVEYTVKLWLPEGKRLFVMDQTGTVLEVTRKQNNETGHLKYSDDGQDNNTPEKKGKKKIKFSWNVGDPPIGSGP